MRFMNTLQIRTAVALAALSAAAPVLADGAGQGSGDPPAVAIVVPLAFFAALVAIVVVPLVLRKKRREIDAAVQRAAIEKGMQYVPELPAPRRPARDDKRTGLLLAGLGLAAVLPLFLAGYRQWALVGLAPIVLGAAFYLVGVLLPPRLEG
jgi:hypothetical protein